MGNTPVCGILQTLATREAYLCDPSHRIRFVFTPKQGVFPIVLTPPS